MIEIGDKSICVLCQNTITWNGKAWVHETFEDHPPKPPFYVAKEPRRFVDERQA